MVPPLLQSTLAAWFTDSCRVPLAEHGVEVFETGPVVSWQAIAAPANESSGASSRVKRVGCRGINWKAMSKMRVRTVNDTQILANPRRGSARSRGGGPATVVRRDDDYHPLFLSYRLHRLSNHSWTVGGQGGERSRAPGNRTLRCHDMAARWKCAAER